ncbi:hypothetical protein [Paenibacillus thiaminolyticus]|uniref:Uncharacterized protein n=1 Tax=Paenibacillus thiaminolyticus TaxID=49283 RepID=A0A3A3GED8_PANTH|nr:hypothetical protein [Paenibacillus thiaminolyticus]RJG21341.1 hypothetical protein DQX05_21810 [Paenibacillus thiaminolyticus]
MNMYFALGVTAALALAAGGFVVRARRKQRHTNRFHVFDDTGVIEARQVSELLVDIQEEVPELILSNSKKERVLEKTVGNCVIAVAGVDRGVGCTHLAIMIANQLAKRNYAVALVEADQSDEFGYIEAAYEGLKQPSSRTHFHIHGVTYFRSAHPLQMSQLMSEYSYIVLDVGDYKSSSIYKEFTRASIPVLVGAGSEWKQHKLKQYVEQHDIAEPHRQNWRVCVSLADRESLLDVKSMIPEYKLFGIPYHTDPFKLSEQMSELMDSIVSVEPRRISSAKRWLKSFFY